MVAATVDGGDSGMSDTQSPSLVAKAKLQMSRVVEGWARPGLWVVMLACEFCT